MNRYREEILNKLEETEEKARQIDCWRSIIFFISPINKTLEYRVIYAEHQHDAQQWAYDMHEKYSDMRISHCVYSSAYDSNYAEEYPED
jgi:hypothetical protein